MTTKSKFRGHDIIYDNVMCQWVLAETGESPASNLPCNHCGLPPTKEGYDACLGNIEGAVSACCGHGDESARMVMYEEKK